MPRIVLTEGTDLDIVRHDRSYGGETTTVMTVNGATGAVAISELECSSLTSPVVTDLADLTVVVQNLGDRSPLTAGNIGDFNFLSGQAVGTPAHLTEQYSEYIAMGPDKFLEIPTPSETMSGNSDNSLVWVRLDQLQTPYRQHRNFYIGTVLVDEASITNSGTDPESGLKSLEHLATRFCNRLDGFADLAPDFFSTGIHGNSVDGFTDAATIGVAVPYVNPSDPEGPPITPTVDPFQPQGDFGPGTFGAEVASGEVIAPFSLCFVDPDGYVRLMALGLSPTPDAIIGVAQNGGDATSGNRAAVILKTSGTTPVVLDTDVTPVLGQRLYSAAGAGKLTNVSDDPFFIVGRVLSVDTNGVCKVLLNIAP